jgi:glycosyltransferase involved in cell wall biosynthesis
LSGEPSTATANMIDNLNILILVPALRRKGPVLGAIALAPELSRLGARVTIGRLDAASELTDAEMQRFSDAEVSITAPLGKGWLGLKNILIIRKQITKLKIDAVISYGLRPDIVNSMLPKRIVRIGYVRNMIVQDYRHNTKYRLVADVLATAHHFALRRMDGVIALSDEMMQLLRNAKIKESRLIKVMNFLDGSWFEQPSDFQPKTSNETQIRFGYFGALSKRKRVDWIINSVADVIQDKSVTSEILLEIVGEGPERIHLEGLVRQRGIEKNVSFRGSVTDVKSHMQECGYILLASETEGVPRVFMEGMSVGATCVGPNIGGVAEMLENGNAGYLYEPTSHTALSNVLITLASQNKIIDRKTLIENSHEKFSAENAGKAIASLVVGIRNSK